MQDQMDELGKQQEALGKQQEELGKKQEELGKQMESKGSHPRYVQGAGKAPGRAVKALRNSG